MTQTPWAILLCKYKDNDSEPYPLQRYDDLFTSSGVGKLNMVDFFQDMSHGQLDLTGSQVFGWYTLDQKTTDYTGSGANPPGRSQLVQWARQKAIDNQVDLTKFYNVVVSMNVPTDLFGSPGGVVCDDGRRAGSGMSQLSPGMVGQEMTHGYGLLGHSRTAGSETDYTDQWDTMSTETGTMAAHPYFTERDLRGNPLFTVGPGLNAANMSSLGWLDLSRVWTANREEYGTSVDLRPLHRRELPGYLAVQVGPFFIEFRVPELWDAGIGTPVVLVHTFLAGNSYLYSGSSGSQGLTAGDKFEYGDTSPAGLGPVIRVDVAKIDPVGKTATVQITRLPDRHPGPAGPAGGGVGVPNDGGGIVMIGGKIHRIPPSSPLVEMLKEIAALQESELITQVDTRRLMRKEALERISSQANSQLKILI